MPHGRQFRSSPYFEASVQIDRIPIPAADRELTGTGIPPIGVEDADRLGEAASRMRLSWRGALAVIVGALSLLGQGERYRVDPRFVSPSSTIANFWAALRRDDEQAASECLVAGNSDMPEPGTLWFLPPTTDLILTSFHSLPVTSGRVLVRYEVRYRPVGVRIEQRFVTGNELVREGGEWRIARALGEASMPEWKPIPRTVDI